MRLHAFLVVPVVTAGVLRGGQVPIAEDMEDASQTYTPITAVETEHVAPGIGIQFTTSYALAAARFANGTVKDLAKIQGDAEYIELMSRWMEEGAKYDWREDWSVTFL